MFLFTTIIRENLLHLAKVIVREHVLHLAKVIVREHVLHLAKVIFMLKHSVKLRLYILRGNLFLFE